MDVFVYGTLTDHATATAVLDTYEYRGAAELVGLHRLDGRYPTLSPGGKTAGRILRTPDIEALDEYEGVDRGLYVRIAVPLASADESVECYVGDPDALGAPVEWPGEGDFERRVRAYCTEADVVVRRPPE
ncbi:gamma-glutamylcyclotransferase [Halomicroarcula sp. S1AR25-4]|uniref:gamma-glutamylcyclotransferase family protein n=1 Tax=Haloarcula sp. S1AR25-4 TaxID=2950538 RepID=UPI002876C1F1|nr:gamma-glutamylcyclotransferase family protein [Halomicroarcula sp. S1AR25-4]MDS0278200.1 gamma-glutamylcyclotransferase [Halomicroarcula sp. S1AR25-4]